MAAGGCWGCMSPAFAECLRTVPMSQPDTGELSRCAALRTAGLRVELVGTPCPMSTPSTTSR